MEQNVACKYRKSGLLCGGQSRGGIRQAYLGTEADKVKPRVICVDASSALCALVVVYVYILGNSRARLPCLNTNNHNFTSLK